MAYPDFVAAGAEVFGVSPDSVQTLERYAREKETPFQFISDKSRALADAYGARKGGRQPRVTFVIKRGGTVAGSTHHEFLIPKHISSTIDLVRSL